MPRGGQRLRMKEVASQMQGSMLRRCIENLTSPDGPVHVDLAFNTGAAHSTLHCPARRKRPGPGKFQLSCNFSCISFFRD